jgi:hypothetical protein
MSKTHMYLSEIHIKRVCYSQQYIIELQIDRKAGTNWKIPYYK